MQTQVAEFVERHGLEISPAFRMLDLTSEMGELAKEILKGTSYGKNEFRPSENWADELGDVLFALICVANSTGVDIEQSLNQVLQKYQRRFDSTESVGSGN